MERVPIELWQKIGEHACLDGGLTGCSLSLVSHAMRDMTRDVRYTSVALTSQKACFIFAHLLDSISSRPTIRHLLFSFNAHSTVLDISSQRRQGLLENAYLRILVHASTTLVTLTQLGFGHINVISKAELCFPRLRDLSIPGLPYSHTQGSLPHPSAFPVLKRIHVCNTTTIQGLELWEYIAEHVPSVETVRLTNTGQDRYLPSVLRVLLGAPALPADESRTSIAGIDDRLPPGSPNFSRATAIAAKLPDLMHVIVQPGREVGHYYEQTSAGMLVALDSVVSATHRNARRLSVMEGTLGYKKDQAWKDWMDGVVGGRGAWAPVSTPAFCPTFYLSQGRDRGRHGSRKGSISVER